MTDIKRGRKKQNIERKTNWNLNQQSTKKKERENKTEFEGKKLRGKEQMLMEFQGHFPTLRTC